jgi:hypothetical protein
MPRRTPTIAYLRVSSAFAVKVWLGCFLLYGISYPACCDYLMIDFEVKGAIFGVDDTLKAWKLRPI